MAQNKQKPKLNTINTFLQYREHINQAVEAYREARQKYGWEGNSETIEALARPFMTGYFTLAVVGEMSAGKSTFINALLKKRNLLATGFGQTTSVITEIQHAEKARYEVLFADGEMKGYDSPDALREHMALREEFVDLPIKQINELIVAGQNFDDILSHRSRLEKCSGKCLNEALLSQYVAEHNRSNIPHRVRIYTPLKVEFQGWKIIDTPGVAATGGVDQETYDLLESKDETGRNNMVDAIIFVNSAHKGIEEATFRNFVKETIEKLPETVKQRLFLVRTRGANFEYLQNKTQQDKEAKKLFVDTLGIEEGRLLVVDSLMQQLIDYAEEVNKDLKILKGQRDTPETWEKKSWDSARKGLREVEDYLDEEGKSINQENLKRELDLRSNFTRLNAALISFVDEEKSRVYHEILGKIRSDYDVQLSSCQKQLNNLQKYVGNLEGLKEALAKNEKKAEEVNQEMNIVLNDLGRRYGRLYIDRYFREIAVIAFDTDANIDSMKVTFRKCMSEVNEGCRRLFKEITQDLETQYKGFLNTSALTMPNIDFDNIGTQAVETAWYDKVVGYEKKIVKADYFGSSFMRFFTLDIFGYDEIDDKSKPITEKHFDRNKARQTFRNDALKQFTEAVAKLKRLIAERVDELGRRIQDKLEKEVVRLKIQNKDLQKRCEKKEERLKLIEENLAVKAELEGLVKTLDNITTIQ